MDQSEKRCEYCVRPATMAMVMAGATLFACEQHRSRYAVFTMRQVPIAEWWQDPDGIESLVRFGGR